MAAKRFIGPRNSYHIWPNNTSTIFTAARPRTNILASINIFAPNGGYCLYICPNCATMSATNIAFRWFLFSLLFDTLTYSDVLKLEQQQRLRQQ